MQRILIIEDDKLQARIYEKRLLDGGYTVATAGDGERGLEMVREQPPALVVLDLYLPKKNGAEVLHTLRADPSTRDLPVVVFSTAFVGDLLRQARTGGASRILNKAKDSPADLFKVINELIGPPKARPLTPTPAVVEESPTDDAPIRQFLTGLPATMERIRQLLQIFLIRGSGNLSKMVELQQTIRTVVGGAAVADLPLAAHLAGATEALLRELTDRPGLITPAVQQTVGGAVESLLQLLERGQTVAPRDFSSLKVLTADDDPVALRMIRHALLKARLIAEALENPTEAEQRLAQQAFDLILLDINMPDLDGAQLCERLRRMPTNANTPVIFVTSVGEFEKRQQAVHSGGNDLIAKPFLPSELAVKALTQLIGSWVRASR